MLITTGKRKMITTIKKNSQFEKEVLSSEVALVDFWSSLCIPCRLMSSDINELAKEFDKVNFFKVNVLKHFGLAREYDVLTLPTLIVFKQGKPIKRLTGYKTRKELRKVLSEKSNNLGVNG